MNDREYDEAKFEIEIRNDELVREWLLHKLGRRAEVLFNGEENRRGQRPQAPNTQSYP